MEQQPDIPLYYALEQLAEYRRTIAALADLLPVYRERLGEYLAEDKAKAKDIYDLITKERDRLASLMGEIRLALLEIGEEKLADVAATLRPQLAAFPVMAKDYTKLSEILVAFAASLPETQTASAAVIGHLMNSVKMGYYPTDTKHMELLAQGIAFPPGVITNVFDPCCGEGIALRTLATGNNCMTYGVELDDARAAEAQERLHRVAVGSFFHSRISHEAFHVMLLNPPYLSVINESGSKARHEKRFLADSYEHLLYGGLLIYIVPYYRLTADIARILCDNFSDLSVYRFMGAEFTRFRQAAVLGTRKRREDGSGLVADFMRMVDDVSLMPELSELPHKRYSIPDQSVEVQLFKGSVFNEVELARQLASSKSIAKLLAKSALDSTVKRPILPLNIGQIGLIGGSGMLNGLAMCDNPHIVKGRIIKEITADEQVMQTDRLGNAVKTTRTETSSNKLVFNILTPLGFKSLN